MIGLFGTGPQGATPYVHFPEHYVRVLPPSKKFRSKLELVLEGIEEELVGIEGITPVDFDEVEEDASGPFEAIDLIECFCVSCEGEVAPYREFAGIVRELFAFQVQLDLEAVSLEENDLIEAGDDFWIFLHSGYPFTDISKSACPRSAMDSPAKKAHTIAGICTS